MRAEEASSSGQEAKSKEDGVKAPANPAVSLAPVKMRTPLGEMMEYYLKMEPHLFRDAVSEQLQRLRDERDAETERKRVQQEGELGEQGNVSQPDNSELVLYKRMEQAKANDERNSLEDVMYISVLEKFVELGVDMMPHIQQGQAEASQAMFQALTEGIHSKEALDMVKDHVRSIMGPAAMAFANTMLQISKLQAAQVYAASIMFGYFVRRVDKRFQLERSLGLLAEQQEDAVARLERLFSQADSLELVDNPDVASGATSSPSSSGGSAPATPPSSPTESSASTSPSLDDFPGGTGSRSDQDSAPASPKQVKSGALRRYIDSFDQATMMQMARLVSAEGAQLVERQTCALFGNLKQLQRQMQEAVGQDASSMEELMQRVGQAVGDGRVESLTISVSTQRRAVLEAIAFGTFLRDVETWVDTDYALLTPASSGQKGEGGSSGDGFAGVT